MTHYILYKYPKPDLENEDLFIKQLKTQLGWLRPFYNGGLDIGFEYEDFLMNRVTVQVQIPLMASDN